MNILILGGTGFLGENLYHSFINQGYNLTIVSRHSAKESTRKNHLIRFIQKDFYEIDDFTPIVKGQDYILHLISSMGPGDKNLVVGWEKEINATFKLLTACVNNSTKNVIFFSSGGTVYGIPQHLPLCEEDHTNPISLYGIQKLMLEKYFLFFNYTYGLNIKILRLSNPYGKYQRPFSKQGLISNLLGRYFTGQSIEIWGDGEDIRDYIYIQDVVNAVEHLLKYTGKTVVFNISSGKGYSINKIIHITENILGDEIKKKYISARKQDVPINILDNKKAIKELKWRPITDIQEGIKKMILSWDGEQKRFTKEKNGK